VRLEPGLPSTPPLALASKTPGLSLSSIILTVVFEMDNFSGSKEKEEEKQGQVGSVTQFNH
jgi:hypothetical protein